MHGFPTRREHRSLSLRSESLMHFARTLTRPAFHSCSTEATSKSGSSVAWRRRLPLFGMAILITLASAAPTEGQGLLRRLGNRLRGGSPAPQYRAPQTRQPQYQQPVQPRQSARYAPNPSPASRLSPRSSTSSPNGTGEDSAEGSDSTPASLGVIAQQVTVPVAGVQIVRFLPDSTLQAAGLRPGDILVSLNGAPTPDLDEMGKLLRRSKPGQLANIRLVRGRTAYDARAELIAGANPPSDSAQAVAAKAAQDSQASPVASQKNLDSGDVAKIDKLGLALDTTNRARGIVVNQVEPGSVAAVSGVQVGDQIVSLDGRMLRSVDALKDAVNEKNDLTSSKLQIVRDNRVVIQRLRDPGEISTVPAAAEVSVKDDAKPKSTVGSLGSMLGGFFGGGSAKAATMNEPDIATESVAESREPAAKATPSDLPAPSTDVFEAPVSDDVLAFGDDEPVDTDSFDLTPPERDID